MLTRTPRFSLACVLLALVATSAGCATTLTTRQPATRETSSDTPRGWRLTFADDFNSAALDPAKWRSEDAAIVKNEELQYYSPAAISLRDGNLVISATKQPRDGRPYTSGQIDTRGRFYQTFGRFEARAKVPAGRGLWPAFWTLPEAGGWPPEIDFFETLGHQPDRVYTYYHWGRLPDHKWHSGGGHELGSNYTAGFHDFACEWTPDRIEWFVDGVSVQTFHTQIPTEPFYIIFNLAVGGGWPGSPDAATVFPAEFLVDSVRVYMQDDDGPTVFLSLQNPGGLVSTPNDKYAFSRNQSISLNAQPLPGQRFVKWTGDVQSTANPLTLVMNRSKHIQAVFEPDPNGPKLLSKAKPALASSDEGLNLTPNLAFDDSPNSRWSSAFSDPQWLQVDLGASKQVQAVRLYWSASFASEYKLQASDDATSWRDIFVESQGNGHTDIITGLEARARYVRMIGTKRGGPYGYSLWDFEVFGKD